MKQRDAFVRGEGDRYFGRNRTVRPPQDDPLLDALLSVEPRPGRVLEIGAANGWRLAELTARVSTARCVGVDPSMDAARDANRLGLERARVLRATAEQLPFATASFDSVLFGFCLYLCDREDLFRIAAEADRVLRDGGTLGILDFHADEPHRRTYGHRDGLSSFKMDHARMFAWNPAYRSVAHTRILGAPAPGIEDEADRTLAVTVFEKRVATAYPLRGEAETAVESAP